MMMMHEKLNRSRAVRVLYAMRRREGWLKWHYDRGCILVPVCGSPDDHYLASLK